MTQNEEIRAKAAELAASIEDALAAAGVNIDHQYALRLVDNFASIDPPQHDTRMYWLAMADS